MSEKKLVSPTTQATCLGVNINTIAGTISIPPEKLDQITNTVKLWLTKMRCTKKELQSLLGQLLYVHKCVRPARIFLNRMLELLRHNYENSVINLTHGFRRDLRWFDRFLRKYNGVSMYCHKNVDHSIEPDACLHGLGAIWKNYVYHLPIPRYYMNLTIVHLEMVNVLVALKAFAAHWSKSRVLIKCDNEAVVRVLSHGRTKDPFLAACARNIWQIAALHDIDLVYIHILGKKNIIADLLSRWTASSHDIQKLHSLVQDPLWLQVTMDFLDIDNEI